MIKKNTLIRKIVLLSLLIVLGLGFSHFNYASAAGLVPCGLDPNGSDACNICDLFKLADNVIKFFVFKLVPLIATLSFVYAGVLFLTSGASPGNFTAAKTIMTNVSIGLALIFSAWMITNTLIHLAVVDQNIADHWYQIECKTTLSPTGQVAGGSGNQTPPGGGQTPGSGTGGSTGRACAPSFGVAHASGCPNLNDCVNVNSYVSAHDCGSNKGTCLLSSDAANRLNIFASSFTSIGGAKCSLRMASALQVNGGPSASSCHKPGNSDSGTCADFNIDYKNCKDAFYKAAQQSGAVYSFLDEYVCPASTTTGNNIHVNF